MPTINQLIRSQTKQQKRNKAPALNASLKKEEFVQEFTRQPLKNQTLLPRKVAWLN